MAHFYVPNFPFFYGYEPLIDDLSSSFGFETRLPQNLLFVCHRLSLFVKLYEHGLIVRGTLYIIYYNIVCIYIYIELCIYIYISICTGIVSFSLSENLLPLDPLNHEFP